jgi:hypothetical protein
LHNYITIGAFEELNENEKLKVLMSNGRVVSEKKDTDSRCFLYYLGSFFAAVKYKTATDDLIGIETFERIGRKERIEWKVLQVLPGLQ